MALSSRVKACYINFILLLVVGVLIYISGFILWLSEPSGRLRGKTLDEKLVLGLNRNSWRFIHISSGILFLVLVVIHICLNWTWIKNVTKCFLSKNREKK